MSEARLGHELQTVQKGSCMQPETCMLCLWARMSKNQIMFALHMYRLA